MENKTKNILVTGCTSFVGEEFVKMVYSLNKDLKIRCFVRSTSNIEELKKLNLELYYGDLRNVSSIKESLDDIEILVHISGIMFVPYILEALKESNVKKGIFVNTTGVFSKYKAFAKDYQRWELEMISFFSKNNIDYAIVRPTMIYGNEKDKNVKKLVLYLNKHSYFPIFGDGSALIQPVYYKDVANALLTLVENEQCWGKAYNIPGKEPITYKRFIEVIGETLRKKVKFVHLPLQPFVLGASILEKIVPRFPIKSEQILRTTEDRAFDYTNARKCFGYDPISFEEGIKLEIEELKKKGYLV